MLGRLLILCVFITYSFSQAIVYVAPGGTGTGASPQSPLGSMSAAHAAVTNGGVVEFAAGTYDFINTFSPTTAVTKNITVRGAGVANTIISCDNELGCSAGLNAVFSLQSSALTLTVQGFAFVDVDQSGSLVTVASQVNTRVTFIDMALIRCPLRSLFFASLTGPYFLNATNILMQETSDFLKETNLNPVGSVFLNNFVWSNRSPLLGQRFVTTRISGSTVINMNGVTVLLYNALTVMVFGNATYTYSGNNFYCQTNAHTLTGSTFSVSTFTLTPVGSCGICSNAAGFYNLTLGCRGRCNINGPPAVNCVRNTLYVNAQAPVTGSGTFFSPFQTIAEAITAARYGDIISLFEGNYSGPGQLNNTVTNKGLIIETYRPNPFNVPPRRAMIFCTTRTFGLAFRNEWPDTLVRDIEFVGCAPAIDGTGSLINLKNIQITGTQLLSFSIRSLFGGFFAEDIYARDAIYNNNAGVIVVVNGFLNVNRIAAINCGSVNYGQNAAAVVRVTNSIPSVVNNILQHGYLPLVIASNSSVTVSSLSTQNTEQLGAHPLVACYNGGQISVSGGFGPNNFVGCGIFLPQFDLSVVGCTGLQNATWGAASANPGCGECQGYGGFPGIRECSSTTCFSGAVRDGAGSCCLNNDLDPCGTCCSAPNVTRDVNNYCCPSVPGDGTPGCFANDLCNVGTGCPSPIALN